nr:mitochondrial fission 1 protein A-like [Ipomoea batatas]
MEAKITQLFDSVVTSFFNSAGDELPWSSADSIRACEREVADAIKDWCDDKIAPDWSQALSLKKAVEDQITKDGVIGIGITATAVGLLAGIIALARNNY